MMRTAASWALRTCSATGRWPPSSPGWRSCPDTRVRALAHKLYSVCYIHGPGVQSTADLCTPGLTSLRHPYANAIVTAGGVIRLSAG